jgi:hypothetical protein
VCQNQYKGDSKPLPKQTQLCRDILYSERDICNHLAIKQAFSFPCLTTLEIPFFFSYLLTFGTTSIIVSRQEGYVDVLSRSRAHEIIIVLYYQR